MTTTRRTIARRKARRADAAQLAMFSPTTGARFIGRDIMPTAAPAIPTTLSEAEVRGFALKLHTPDAVGMLARTLSTADVPAEVAALHSADSLRRTLRRVRGGSGLTAAQRATLAAVREGRAAVRRCDRATGRVATLADAAAIARMAEVVTADAIARAAEVGTERAARAEVNRVAVADRTEVIEGVGTIPAPLDGPGAAWMAARAERQGSAILARSALAGWTSTGLDSRTGRYRTVTADRVESTTVATGTGQGSGNYRDSAVRAYSVPAEVVRRMIDGTATDADRAIVAAARGEGAEVGRTTGRTRKVHSRRQSAHEVALREWALSRGIASALTDAEVEALESLRAAKGGAGSRKRAKVLVGALRRCERIAGEACPATLSEPIVKATKKG